MNAPGDEGSRSPVARLIASLRLAGRQTLHGWSSSLLVLTLIVLPMAVVTAALVYVDGRQPTTAERIEAQLGRAQAWLAIVNGPDPSLRQYFDQPEWWQIDRSDDGQPVHEPRPPVDDPVRLLTDGDSGPAEVIEIGEGDVTAETAGGIAPVAAVIGDAGAEALRGRFDLHEGRAATAPTEVVVSPGALERLGASVGDTLTLREPAARYTIVGVLSRAEDPDAREVVFLPGTAENRALQSDAMLTRWYLPARIMTSADVETLNRAGVIVFDRSLVADPGARAAPGGAEALPWSILAVLSAVAAFAGYLIVLLAGAAFSVSARRQEHALAVAASVGATRGDVFRIVLLQGTVLGLAGGTIGAGAGIGLGVLALHLFDDGAAASFWGVHVPWPLLAAVVAFATIVGTIAAVVPARAATRGEVIAALRGSRKPVRVRADRPLWGTLLLVTGVAITAIAGLWLAAINAEKYVDQNDARRILCIWGIILGPLLLQVGVMLAGHWIIAQLARVLSRIGLASRLAGRDAAAHPGRIVPAFAAIAACAFLASVSLGSLAVVGAQQERGWWYGAPVGTLSVYGWIGAEPGVEPLSAAEVRATEARAREVAAGTDPASIGTLWLPLDPRLYDASGKLVTNSDATTVLPQVQRYVSCDDVVQGECLTKAQSFVQGGWALAVVAADEIDTVVGRTLTSAQREAYRAGGAVLLDRSYATPDDVLVLSTLTVADADGAWERDDLRPAATTRVPALVLDDGRHRERSVLISPAAAERAGVVVDGGSWQVVAAYAEPPAITARDAVWRDAAALDSRALNVSAQYEDGPPDAALWLVLVVGVTAVLVVAASAVALGLARVERRPDDATLAAVGGSSVLRRGIAGWQAVIVAGIGMVTGVSAGVLPVWGVSMASATMSNPPLFSDMPWGWLVVLGVGLPVVIAAVSWIVPPRRPELTRRTAIA
ncbi:ABC transporter permease [Microbacterium sp. TNHR37B]|uniref:ABC transporter permease n=1 Tax=Microbacterium sp. TNHR37B TaxID=1775956 RepID=UPI0007B28C48|nr:FtsX-like permease family protein [Microbacterium sp. TNHR37B]KZE88625.1 hypothetical protein AVP41_03131 [Microbacterium sp. TNHR37B]